MDRIDILNRGEFVDRLVNLTEKISSNKKSTSFAINGSWGCGKSFVLDMYEKRIKSIQSEEFLSDKYFVIRYNCWKYDYYQEPLISIVSVLIEEINQNTKLWNDAKSKAVILGTLKAIGATLIAAANNHVANKTGIDFLSAYKAVKSSTDREVKKIKNDKIYDVLFSFNEALKTLQKLIDEICERTPIIFIVDELDRCLPEYAIKVLERLHHLTDNKKNIISIISVDRCNLEQSISKIMGVKEPNKYLKKFIQFELSIDNGLVSEKFFEKHSDYISLFEKNSIQYDDSIEEIITEIFKGIDVRNQEQLVEKAMIIHKMLFEERKDYSFLCVELLSIVLMHYQKSNWFSNWFNKLNGSSYTEEKPPFCEFFDEKFEKIAVYDTIMPYGVTKNCFSITIGNSLYSAIAYIWYMAFFEKQSINKLVIDKKTGKEIRERINGNIKDLIGFNEMLNLIR